jgi:hypothetical protein
LFSSLSARFSISRLFTYAILRWRLRNQGGNQPCRRTCTARDGSHTCWAWRHEPIKMLCWTNAVH